MYICRLKKHKATMRSIQQLISVAAAAMLTACGGRFSHPDTSNIDVDITVRPFYQELFGAHDASPEAKADRLTREYGSYFVDYCDHELCIGSPLDTANHDSFVDGFSRFLGIEENKEVIATCDSVYGSLRSLSADVTDAFRCFKYYFPSKRVPSVSVHFSGFNSKMFITADSLNLSLSIEHYLGADCRYYPMLEIPLYARQIKTPQNIVPDMVKAWLYANYPNQSETDDVLTALIYQGKILYALNMCVPSISDELLFGFTAEQLEWCQQCKRQMWTAMVEQKLLYSTNPLDRNKLVNETPFTVFFGQNSPGRAALYCAFGIVDSYMKAHPGTTIEQLLEQQDAHQLLIEAQYVP